MAFTVDIPHETLPVTFKGCYARVERCALERDASGAKIARLTILARAQAPTKDTPAPLVIRQVEHLVQDTTETIITQEAVEGHWTAIDPDKPDDLSWVAAVEQVTEDVRHADYTDYFGEDTLKASSTTPLAQAYKYLREHDPLFARAENA